MMNTETLIARLADELKPVRPLDPPERRARRFALVMAFGLVAVLGLRLAFSRVQQDSGLAVDVTLGTAGVVLFLAAYAAFLTATPDRPVRRTWLLAPVLVVWLLPLIPAALRQWTDAGFALRSLVPSIDCILVTVLLSILPLLLIASLFSNSASRSPAMTGGTAGLAVGAAVWIGLRILISHPDSMALDMVAEQIIVCIVLSALGAIVGPTLIGRISPRSLQEELEGQRGEDRFK
jgi:hypothetical protein